MTRTASVIVAAAAAGRAPRRAPPPSSPRRAAPGRRSRRAARRESARDDARWSSGAAQPARREELAAEKTRAGSTRGARGSGLPSPRPRDVGDEQRPDAERGEAARGGHRVSGARRPPSSPRTVGRPSRSRARRRARSATRVKADEDDGRRRGSSEGRERRRDRRTAGCRRRPGAAPPVEEIFDRGGRAQAAPDLHRDPDASSGSSPISVAVRRPSRTRRRGRPRGGRRPPPARIASRSRPGRLRTSVLASQLAAEQPDDAPAAEVDRGPDRETFRAHAASLRGSSRGSAVPASDDFSGWNWQPQTFPRSAAAGEGSAVVRGGGDVGRIRPLRQERVDEVDVALPPSKGREGAGPRPVRSPDRSAIPADVRHPDAAPGTGTTRPFRKPRPLVTPNSSLSSKRSW